MRRKLRLWCCTLLPAVVMCAVAKGNDLLLANDSTSDGILRYNSTTGTFIRSFLSTPIVSPASMTYGPDGNLYVASSSTHSITRYQGQTGQFIDTFVASQSGGLDAAYDMTFGPDGNLYVAERSKGILRYNGATGASLGAWGTSGAGQLTRSEGVTFAPDGKMYVGDDHHIRRYDAAGAYLDDFPTSIGIEGVGRLRFGPDGNLWVPTNSFISRLNAITGASAGGLSGITRDVTFREDGRFLQDSSCTVNSYDWKTGTSTGFLIPCNDGHLSNATAMLVMLPEPAILLWAAAGAFVLLRRR
jgi:streptogramin lyase